MNSFTIRLSTRRNLCLIISLLLTCIIGFGIRTPIIAANIAASASLFLILSVTSLTVAYGPLGPLVVRQNLARIGMLNRQQEAPFLLKIRNDPDVTNGMILTFENRGLPREDWETKQAELESIFKIIILKIKEGITPRTTIIHAVPAKGGIPDFVAWDNKYLSSKDFVISLGIGAGGLYSVDFNTVPHLLCAGATSSGKSVVMRSIILQSLLLGAVVRVIDKKECMDYALLAHERLELVSEDDRILEVLKTYAEEVRVRNKFIKEAFCDNLADYNRENPDHQHRRIIIICDEVAELLDKTGLNKTQREYIDEVLGHLSSIARLGRAAGIHLVLASQRPDCQNLPGQVKSNISLRLCGRADLILSQVVLGHGDAHDRIPADAMGRFLTHDGTLFQAFWVDKYGNGALSS